MLSVPGDPCRFCYTTDPSGGWLERQQRSGKGQTGLTRDLMASLSPSCLSNKLFHQMEIIGGFTCGPRLQTNLVLIASTFLKSTQTQKLTR